MRALPNSDGGQPAGDEIGHVRVLRQDQRERTGPEGGGEFAHCFGDFFRHDCDGFQIAARGDVDDERIEGRALLGGEDLGDGGRVEGIRGEAIDGFGRQGDDFAIPQQGAGLAHGVFHIVIGGLNNSGLGHGGFLPEDRAGCELLFSCSFAARSSLGSAP